MTDSDAAASPAIEAQGLAVRYGRTVVLEDVGLAVPRGAVYALLGRNGSGKSSLLRVLLGGRPPEMTAAQLSAFCGRLYRRWDAEAVAERLRRFEVPPDRRFASLSKGQKGSVMLALALGHGPELLVLDDPTLGLDVVAREAVFDEVIGDLADRGTTVFVTTHDLRAIEGIADQVAILGGGRVVLSGVLEALKAERGLTLEQLFASVAGTRTGDGCLTEVRR